MNANEAATTLDITLGPAGAGALGFLLGHAVLRLGPAVVSEACLALCFSVSGLEGTPEADAAVAAFADLIKRMLPRSGGGA